MLNIDKVYEEIEGAKDEARKLISRREELVAEIQRIDQRLATIAGQKSSKRAVNSSPLRPIVREALAAPKGGLTLAELAKAILATGYRSNARNFRNVVYQCVYNSGDCVCEGMVYKLRKAS